MFNTISRMKMMVLGLVTCAAFAFVIFVPMGASYGVFALTLGVINGLQFWHHRYNNKVRSVCFTTGLGMGFLFVLCGCVAMAPGAGILHFGSGEGHDIVLPLYGSLSATFSPLVFLLSVLPVALGMSFGALQEYSRTADDVF
jgi:hypothetical protein